MKRLVSFLLVIMMMFTLSMPVFAWSNGDVFYNEITEKTLSNIFEKDNPDKYPSDEYSAPKIYLHDNSTGIYYLAVEAPGSSRPDKQFRLIYAGSSILLNYGGNGLRVYESKNGSAWLQTKLPEFGTKGNPLNIKVLRTVGASFVLSSNNGMVPANSGNIKDYPVTITSTSVSCGHVQYKFLDSGGGGRPIDPDPTPEPPAYDEDSLVGKLLNGIKSVLESLFSPFTKLLEVLTRIVDNVVMSIRDILVALAKVPELITSLMDLVDANGTFMTSIRSLFPANSYGESVFAIFVLLAAFNILLIALGIVRMILLR